MKKQDPRLIDQRRITPTEMVELRKLSDELFQGDMFKVLSPEEEALAENSGYNALVKKLQFSRLMAVTLDRKK